MVIVQSKQQDNYHCHRKIQQKNSIFDKEAEDGTQDEIGQVLCLEKCIVWQRDLDSKKIKTEVFG